MLCFKFDWNQTSVSWGDKDDLHQVKLKLAQCLWEDENVKKFTDGQAYWWTDRPINAA